MVNQPLNSAFAGRQDDRKKSSRKMIVLGALIVGLAGTVGSVFAATININGGATIDFAQGTQIVAGCDTTDASTTIGSTFDPTANDNDGGFTVSTVTINGLDDACIGSTVEVFLSDGSSILGSATQTVADGVENVNETVVSIGGSVDAAAVTDIGVEIRG